MNDSQKALSTRDEMYVLDKTERGFKLWEIRCYVKYYMQ